MGDKSARKYNHCQADRVVKSVEKILNRMNQKYMPLWLYKELNVIQHNSQCIKQEFERIMRGYGDDI